MAKRSLGKLSKRSRLLRTKNRQRPSISSAMREFKQGDRVSVDPKSGYSGMPHPRYRGMTGIVSSRRGDAYLVKLRVGNSEKTLVIPPIHLR